MLVRNWMCRPPITIKADAPLQEAIDLMTQHKVHILPVVDKDLRLQRAELREVLCGQLLDTARPPVLDDGGGDEHAVRDGLLIDEDCAVSVGADAVGRK